MNWIRANPVFSGLLGILLVLFLVSAGLAFTTGRQLSRMEQEHAAKAAELRNLRNRQPLPTAANLERTQDMLTQSRRLQRDILDTLNIDAEAQKKLFGEPPADRTDSFFRVATFLDNIRRRYEEAGLLQSEQNFSFSAYVRQGPPPELIRRVHEQVVLAGVLLETLLESGPDAFIALRREDPAVSESSFDSSGFRPDPVRTTGLGRGTGDFFVIDPAISTRREGVLHTQAFELTFVGRTDALRGFLNRLANSDLPFQVRSVEVRSLEERATTPAATARPVRRTRASPGTAPEEAVVTTPEAIPIVRENSSRFTVTVEFLELRHEEEVF